jgi:hypothetical protein
LEEENVPLPDFDIKTNNVINEVFVTISEIVDIIIHSITFPTQLISDIGR